MAEEQVQSQASSGVEQLLVALEAMQQRLTHLEDSLRQSELLTAALAHEYRNILTPVAAYAQMALGRPEDQALCHKALWLASEGAERATLMADALMGCSEEPLENGTASLKAAVQAVRLSLESKLRRSVINVHLGEDVLLPLQSVALKQILLNLFLNALHAMGPMGGTIDLGVSELGSSGWRVWCRDQGPGISPAMLGRLFEPGATGATGRRGHGLGLYVSVQLMAEVGGYLLLEAGEGPGATFHLCFPAGR